MSGIESAFHTKADLIAVINSGKSDQLTPLAVSVGQFHSCCHALIRSPKLVRLPNPAVRWSDHPTLARPITKPAIGHLLPVPGELARGWRQVVLGW